MNPGDLVKPLGRCGGQPGSIRCQTAIVIKASDPVGSDPQYLTTWCQCGTSSDYSWHFEKLESMVEVTHSADPM